MVGPDWMDDMKMIMSGGGTHPIFQLIKPELTQGRQQ